MLRLTGILALTAASAAHARLSPSLEALDSAVRTSGPDLPNVRSSSWMAQTTCHTGIAQPLRASCATSPGNLHSGETRTPVYVAQRLNRQTIEDADEKRATKFLLTRAFPWRRAGRTEDYLALGLLTYMAPAGDMPTPTAMAQELQPGQHGAAGYPAQRWRSGLIEPHPWRVQHCRRKVG